jgi:CRP/FNR family nitrogen fixation transcriptional regulator
MTAVAKERELSVLSVIPALQPHHSEYRLGNVELVGARVRYRHDEEIFGEGEEAGNVYRVLNGAVRLYRVLTDGRRQIDQFCLPGDLFGLEFFPNRRISAEAVSDCELVVTSRCVVMQQMERNCAFGRLLFERASIDLAKAQDHAMLLGRKNATERVAAFLLDMSERQGRREVLLPMSRQDIADYLGLTIETVSRTLAELDRRSVLDVAARRIVLRDPAALRQLDS